MIYLVRFGNGKYYEDFDLNSDCPIQTPLISRAVKYTEKFDADSLVNFLSELGYQAHVISY